MSQGNRDASFVGTDFSANFKQVIAKRSDLVRRSGQRMTAPGSDTLYRAGQVLGKVTATGRYAPYNDSNSDGTEVARSVLEMDTMVKANDSSSEIVMIVGGDLLKDLLVGLDAAGIVDLGGVNSVEKGINIFSFWK